MKYALFIFTLLLTFVLTNGFAVKPRKYNYQDPPINIHQQFNVNYGDVSASFVEVIDLDLPVVYDNTSCANYTNQDVILRIGTTGGQEIIIKSFDVFARPFDVPGTVFLKYRSVAPTSGEIICSFY